jgi:putative DNA primase/helicase
MTQRNPDFDSVDSYRSAPVLLRLGDVVPRPVQWLWPRRIPMGAITILVGMPGVGKSFCICDLAARVTTGQEWPDAGEAWPSIGDAPGRPTHAEKGSVILASAEDDPHSVLPARLQTAGANLFRIHLLQGALVETGPYTSEEIVFNLDDLDPLRGAIEQIGDVRLIVIDPIGSYLGAGGGSRGDSTIRATLAPLAALAEKHRLAVVLIAHRRKARANLADDMALGSRAFTAVARSVMHLTRDADDPSRRLLVHGKSNLTGETPGLSFSIVGHPPHLLWNKEPLFLSADEALAEETHIPGRPSCDLEQVTQWLQTTLEDGKPHLIQEIKTAALAKDYSWRTTQRARRGMKVKTIRTHTGFAWQRTDILRRM